MALTKKIVRRYRQELVSNISTIFPLLCPVREKEWLPGWEYRLIFSESGFAEKGCVFETNNEYGTYHWIMTKYDIDQGEIQFVKLTDNEDVIIDIALDEHGDQQTYCDIQYTFIPMTEEDYERINKENSEAVFSSHMRKWEETLNYYLENGRMIDQS